LKKIVKAVFGVYCSLVKAVKGLINGRNCWIERDQGLPMIFSDFKKVFMERI